MAKQKRKKKKKFRLYFWILGLCFGLMALNIVVGLMRRPAHILKPVSELFYKVPSETWSSYRDIFLEYETGDLDATFLAALAQTESSGNPLATPFWQFQLTTDLLKIYQPASSSLGLYQMTAATFQDAKRFCFKNGSLYVDTSSTNLEKCWNNQFRLRFSANDSVHLTAARLSYYTNYYLQQSGRKASKLQRQKLAAVIHLCGRHKAPAFINGNFNPQAIGYCGSHSVKAYLKRIFRYKNDFVALAN